MALSLYAINMYAGGDTSGLVLCTIMLGVVLKTIVCVTWTFGVSSILFATITSYLLYELCHVCVYPVLFTFGGAVLVAGILHRYGHREDVTIFIRILVLLISAVFLYKSPLIHSLQKTGKQAQVAVLEHGKWGRAEDHDGGLNIRAQYSYDALYRLIKATRIPSVEELDKYNELWIITPTTPFTKVEARIIKDWTLKGGHLVVIGDHTDLYGHARVVNHLLTWAGINLKYDCIIDKTGDEGTYRSIEGNLRGLTACSIRGSGEVLALQPGFSERTDYSKRSFFSDYMITGEEESALYCILMRKSYGLGSVAVFSDSTLFANFALSRPSAQRILRMILNTEVGKSLSLYVSIFGFLFLFTRGFIRRWTLVPVALTLLSVGVLECTETERELRGRVHIRGNWQLVEGDRAPYSTLLAASYSECGSIPIWDGRSLSDNRIEVGGKLVDLGKYRGNSLEETPLQEALSKVPRISPLDFVYALIRDASKVSFWFDEGVGLWRDIAYTYFWHDALNTSLPTMPTLGASVPQHATIVRHGKSEVGVSVFVTPIRGSDDWVVVGDWLVAKRVKGNTLLVRDIWQHTTRRYGDFVLHSEER